MGLIAIPPDPIVPGKVCCSLHLEGDEISLLNARLKAVLQHLVDNQGLFNPGARSGTPSSLSYKHHGRMYSPCNMHPCCTQAQAPACQVQLMHWPGYHYQQVIASWS